MHVYRCVCAYMCEHAYVCACASACRAVHAHVCTDAYLPRSKRLRVGVQVHVGAHPGVASHTCAWVYVCLWVQAHTSMQVRQQGLLGRLLNNSVGYLIIPGPRVGGPWHLKGMGPEPVQLRQEACSPRLPQPKPARLAPSQLPARPPHPVPVRGDGHGDEGWGQDASAVTCCRDHGAQAPVSSPGTCTHSQGGVGEWGTQSWGEGQAWIFSASWL